jgi:hypothetical protein
MSASGRCVWLTVLQRFNLVYLCFCPTVALRWNAEVFQKGFTLIVGEVTFMNFVCDHGRGDFSVQLWPSGLTAFRGCR